MESQNLGQTQQFEMLVKEIKQLCEKLESVQTTLRHKQEQQRHEIQKHEEMMDEFRQQFMNLNYTFLSGIETFNLSLKQRLNEILGKELETEIIETKINSSPSGTRSNVTEHFVQQELSRSKNDIDYAELQDYSIQREMEEPATEEVR
uniref:Uncharacterized protein n=1 Tax=Arion vulgaris TaxID=1028688 RepID=A0A0B6ZSJ4_9EUPU